MNNKKQRRLQSFRRVQSWKIAHADAVQAAPPAILTHFTTLDGIVVKLEADAATQESSKHLGMSNTSDATTQRAEVRAHMRPITDVARGLKGSVLGISAIASMPDVHATTERLIAAANAMAGNAATFKQLLLDHGLQPDFIESLQSSAAALKAFVDGKANAKNAEVMATKDIDAVVKQGMVVVGFIQAALMSQLRKDPALMASWENAKRLTAKGVPASPAATSDAATSGATSTTTPAPAVTAPKVA